MGHAKGAGSSVGMNALDGRFLFTQRDTRDDFLETEGSDDNDMMQLVRIGREGRRLTPHVESS